MPRIYLDSCIVIYLLEGPMDLSRSIRSALDPVAGDTPSACFSELTRLECRVGPMRKGAKQVLRKFDEFFMSDDLENLPIDPRTFDLATRIRALQGAKTADAIHLAAAILGGCEEFWTGDNRLKSAAAGKIETRVFSLAPSLSS